MTMFFDNALAAATALVLGLGLPITDAFAQTGEPATTPNYSPAQTAALRDWAYTLALQAASWGAPAVVMYDLRYDDAVGPEPKAAPK